MKTMIAVLSSLLALATTPAWAIGGCVDSPENVTLVLALLGGGVAALPWLRKRLATRRSRQPRSDHSPV